MSTQLEYLNRVVLSLHICNCKSG